MRIGNQIESDQERMWSGYDLLATIEPFIIKWTVLAPQIMSNEFKCGMSRCVKRGIGWNPVIDRRLLIEQLHLCQCQVPGFSDPDH